MNFLKPKTVENKKYNIELIITSKINNETTKNAFIEILTKIYELDTLKIEYSVKLNYILTNVKTAKNLTEINNYYTKTIGTDFLSNAQTFNKKINEIDNLLFMNLKKIKNPYNMFNLLNNFYIQIMTSIIKLENIILSYLTKFQYYKTSPLYNDLLNILKNQILMSLEMIKEGIINFNLTKKNKINSILNLRVILDYFKRKKTLNKIQKNKKNSTLHTYIIVNKNSNYTYT